MNRYFLMLLVLFAQPLLAQDEQEEKQKPSWSSGLPERTSKPTMNKPNMGATQNDDTDRRPDFGFDDDMQVEGFQSELELTPQKEVAEQTTQAEEEEISVENTQQAEQVDEPTNSSEEVAAIPNTDESVTEVEQETPQNTEQGANDSEAYSWQLVTSDPVVLSKTLYYDKDSIRMKVTINPDGEVVRVKAGSRTLSQTVVFSVQKQVKKWRYEPPSRWGISKNITKNLLIPVSSR